VRDPLNTNLKNIPERYLNAKRWDLNRYSLMRWIVIPWKVRILRSIQTSSVNETNRLDLQIRFSSLSTFSTTFSRTSRHKERRDGTMKFGSTVRISCRNLGHSTIDNGNTRPIVRLWANILDNSIYLRWSLVYLEQREQIIAFLIESCFNCGFSSFVTKLFFHLL